MNRPIDTARAVFVQSFQAYDGIHEDWHLPESIMVTVADELDMVAAALREQEPYIEEAERCIRRCVDRLRLALRIEGELPPAMNREPGLGSLAQVGSRSDDKLFFVPSDDDGKPDFKHAAGPVTDEEFAALGWVRRENVSKAVDILLGEKAELNNESPASERVSATVRTAQVAS